MKKAAIIPVMTLFSVMLASCLIFPDPPVIKPNPLDTLEEGSFYARNMGSANSSFYKVEAEMLYEGDKCEIWAEKGSGVTRTMAANIAREYDNKIRKIIVDTFSEKNFTAIYEDVSYDFDDMLDYANWLVGGNDGKLTVLLLDIQDDFDLDKGNLSYVAGYFYSGNFYQPAGKINNSNYSNGRDMIYVDTYPGLDTKLMDPPYVQAYATFAHELQHLVNYVTSVRLERASQMNTWIDEGLSSYAEFLYFGEKNPEDKCEWFSADTYRTIEKGNNFFVWGNHSDKQYAILDDYSTVYLFFRWLYLQAAGTELQSHIFRDITNNPKKYYDYQAVTSVAARINPAWSNWEVLLRTWFAANHDPKNAVYGYKGDLYLQDGYGSTSKRNPEDNYKGIRVNPIEGSTVSLYPGEGVYSIIDGPYSSKGGTNIRYEELNNYLLTFNVNTYNTYNISNPKDNATPETGSLTGVPVFRTAADNSRQAGKQTRPFVIDARDILGRDQDMPNRAP